jgi:PIN domain nuclease of toxin-antitoxin system
LKLLLDTHIWLWSLREPKRLSRRIEGELRNADNELWISPVSTWEALVLSAKGRLDLHESPAAWMRHATAGFREAPLTHEIALASQQLAFTHNDPADRFLAATAKVLGLVLVTADERLLGMGDIGTLANR